ncbi:tetratricopeptide repeat protein [Ulvibacterium sp.]|uniref:tetratricopeptide repeat protein n=1 Tax=Ulvibacterium sp. TaxID=2665914 RepID=UPI003BAD7331
MKYTFSIAKIFVGILLIQFQVYAQEEPIEVEESAEVFLEEYSDAFQEKFFEALKQKGIENYDKAINLLLECRQMDTDAHVIDHELAKVYLADKQYAQAEEYGIDALNAKPENLWYLDTLVNIILKQGSSMNSIKPNIPYANNALRENLALIYFKQKNFEGALEILDEIQVSAFSEELRSKLKDSIEKQKSHKAKTPKETTNTVVSDPLMDYKTKIENLIQSEDTLSLEEMAKEALESYPLQPYFYYALAHALNKKGEHTRAAEELESALDYILDDAVLANKFYEELVTAYTALKDTSKANMYLRKIKPGF